VGFSFAQDDCQRRVLDRLADAGESCRRELVAELPEHGVVS
jgi:hypothetical protein